jgi:hypothetical protein
MVVDGYLNMKVEKPILGSSAENTLTRIKKKIGRQQIWRASSDPMELSF